MKGGDRHEPAFPWLPDQSVFIRAGKAARKEPGVGLPPLEAALGHHSFDTADRWSV
jgi:hypothetical protein